MADKEIMTRGRRLIAALALALAACDGTLVGEPAGGSGRTAASAASCGALGVNEILHVNESAWSCDGRFQLIMQGDGNLVLYQIGIGALWATGTTGWGNWAMMQGDGNFVVYNSASWPLWDSKTYGHFGVKLSLLDDGNLIIYKPVPGGQDTLWSSGTGGRWAGVPRCGLMLQRETLGANQSLWSCDGRFQLIMQSDGNLVLYGTGMGALWSSGTWGAAHSREAVMQSDGNFVLYDRGQALWSTRTYWHPGVGLTLQNDGNLVVYQNSTPIWSSNTGGHYGSPSWNDVVTFETRPRPGFNHPMVIAWVDVPKMKQVQVQSSQPYWFQFYRSFFRADGSPINTPGKCPSFYQPFDAANPNYHLNYTAYKAFDASGNPVFNYDWAVSKDQLIWATPQNGLETPGGAPPSGDFRKGPFYCVYGNYPFLGLGLQVLGTYWAADGLRRKVGEGWSDDSAWYPQQSSGVGFYKLSNPSGSRVYGAPAVSLNSYVSLAAAGPGNLATGYYRTLAPGQVSDDGFGVVPTSPAISKESDTDASWIYVVPKGQGFFWAGANPINYQPHMSDGSSRFAFWNTMLVGLTYFDEYRTGLEKENWP